MATKAPIKKAAPVRKVVSKSPISSPGHRTPESYQAREDMHTLKSAEQIRSDPARHTAAVHHAKTELASLQKVARKKV